MGATVRAVQHKYVTVSGSKLKVQRKINLCVETCVRLNDLGLVSSGS